MPFAPIEKGQLYYCLDGPPDMPILLLSNSLGSDHSMWDQQVHEFAKHFRVVRYDSRGHGLSSVIPGDYTIEMLGKDVIALCDYLKLPTINFCGLSIGGVVGQWLALHVPERIRKLALCNTAAQIGTVDGWNSRIADVEKGGVSSISQTIVARWLTQGYRQSHPEMTERLRKMMDATSAEGYVATCIALRNMDFRGQIPQITLRPLVIVGKQDAATPPEGGRFLAEHIPGAQLLELEAAHFSNVELPEQFTQSVLEFLL